MPLAMRRFVLGPFETNAYLLSCQQTGEAAVLDVGFEPETVEQAIQERGLAVRHLLLTLAHYDHIAAMGSLQQRVGGDCWLHPADLPLVRGLDVQAASFGLPPAQVPAEFLDLADGQRIALGNQTLEVIHTPGHSPGSVTFRAGSSLWVGDLLFAGSVGRTDFPGGSFETLVRSVRERLFPLGDSIRVFPGHGPETTLGQERRLNPFVGEETPLA